MKDTRATMTVPVMKITSIILQLQTQVRNKVMKKYKATMNKKNKITKHN